MTEQSTQQTPIANTTPHTILLLTHKLPIQLDLGSIIYSTDGMVSWDDRNLARNYLAQLNNGGIKDPQAFFEFLGRRGYRYES